MFSRELDKVFINTYIDLQAIISQKNLSLIKKI